MVRVIILLMIVLQTQLLFGQNFEVKYQIPVQGLSGFSFVEAADINNDSIPDFVIAGEDISGNFNFRIYRGFIGADPVAQGFVQSTIQEAVLLLEDIDADNQIDIIISGVNGGDEETGAFLNQGNFTFQYQPMMPARGSVIATGDLDNKGNAEMVLSGPGNSTSIFQHVGDTWVLVTDSLRITSSDVTIANLDDVSGNELLISGIDEQSVSHTILFKNNNGHFVADTLSHQVLTNFVIADFDHNGFLDVVAEDTADHVFSFLFSTGTSIAIVDSLEQINPRKIFSGDFNNDGKTDLALRVINNDTLSIIQTDPAEYDTISVRNIHDETYVDADRDGDLDIIQLIISDTDTLLSIVENKVMILNRAPLAPANALAIPVFNKLFLHWDPSQDDHTPARSITYDVLLQQPGENILNPAFDFLNFNRLLTSHGNNATANFLIVDRPAADGIVFNVQAVDNAFYGNASGLCFGDPASVCVETTETSIEACRNEMITLTASEPSMWFTLGGQFLSDGSPLQYQVFAADTVFSFVPPRNGQCAKVNLYTISIDSERLAVFDSLAYVCEGDQLEFHAESGWTNVSWSSALKGFLTDDENLSFVVEAEDTVSLQLSDGTGCSIVRNTFLEISRPTVVIEEDAFQILKGESVQISASGGVVYEWTPSESLDNAFSANPLATPLETTSYTVVVRDTLGCTDDGTVLVIVEGTAFVPELFTPNDDGKNDAVRLYGMNADDQFTFSIFNREGAMVYSTSSVGEVTQVGWNGSSGGVKQPNGVYYWKITGENSTGRKIFLNGKDAGSIVLVR